MKVKAYIHSLKDREHDRSVLGTAEIIKKIGGNIDDLAGFGGADTKINGTQYTIDSVTDKSLIVVIPSNADESAKNTVYSMGYYAASKGITMTVEEYGTSMKYAE